MLQRFIVVVSFFFVHFCTRYTMQVWTKIYFEKLTYCILANWHMSPTSCRFCSTVVAKGYFNDDDNTCVFLNPLFRFCRILRYERHLKTCWGWSVSVQPRLSHDQNDLIRLKSRSQTPLCSNHGFWHFPVIVWASSEHNHPRAECEFCCQKAKITKRHWQRFRHKSADLIRDRD